MKYQNIGTQAFYVGSERIEPGQEFSAEIDPDFREFLTGIGALAEVQEEAAVEPKPELQQPQETESSEEVSADVETSL